MIELATPLEEKAARLKQEGLGKIKIALMGCNTSFLLDMLEGAFGLIDQETILIPSIPKAKEMITEDIPSTPSTPSPAESGPVGAELVFPTQAIPLVIARIPESLLPIHDLKHSHITDFNSLTVFKYSSKKQQLVPMSITTI